MKSVGWRGLVRALSCLSLISSVSACSSKLDVTTVQGAKAESMQVLSRHPVVVKAGDQVELKGLGFKGTLALALFDAGGIAVAQTLPVAVESATTARFTVPLASKPGIYQLNASQDGQSQMLSLVFTADMLESAIFASDAQNVCAGQKFYDLDGNVREGSKLCEAKASSTSTATSSDPSLTPPECSQDGEVGCLATEAYRAAAMQDIKKKVIAGTTVAGVVGAVVLPAANDVRQSVAYGPDLSLSGSLNPGVGLPANCSSDGETGCIAVTNYKAADMSLATAGNIRSGITIAGVSGSLLSKPADCASDGASGCVVVGPTMAAAVTTGIGSQILSGNAVGGIAGNVTQPAVGKVLTGTTFGVSGTGSTGTLTLPSSGNVLSGSGSFGDPGAAVTPTLTLPVAANVLSSNGAYGVGGTGSTPTLTLPTAANVLASNGAYGVGGNGSTPTLTLPSAGNVLAGNGAYGVGGNGSTPTLTLPAAADVFTGITYGVAGNGATGTLTLASAANVRTGQGAFGRGGTSVTPTLADCSADGATGCVAVAAYKATNMTNVTAANIKSGVTIAGVLGDFPSATNNLAGASVTSDLVSLAASTAAGSYEWWDAAGARYTGTITDAGTITPSTSNQTFSTSLYRTFTVAGSANLTAANIKNGTSLFGVTGAYPSSTNLLTGADSTADLDLATFDAKIKSSASFEWFDAAGNRYTYAGDTDIAAANISNGVSIFGTVGTLTGGPNCTGDGQTSCMTTSRYKSMDTDASVISAWDIRKGKTAGGLAGQIVFYKNMANTALFDRTSGTSALAGVDFYDTIDDFNNNGAFPTQNPTGWDQATGANWLRDSVSDTGAGGGVASDGICNGSEDCVYRDRITGLYWLRDNPTAYT